MESDDQLKMTVINAQTNQTACIDLQQVNYITVENRRLVYHIGKQKFFQFNSLLELEDHLLDRGFYLVDRPNLVNIRNVKHFDKSEGKLFFDENYDAESDYATIARIHVEFVQSEIERAVSINTNTMQEYSLNKRAPSSLRMPQHSE